MELVYKKALALYLKKQFGYVYFTQTKIVFLFVQFTP